MTLMRIHIDDNFADDIDGVVDGNDDCDDDGIGNIDFVLVVLFQGLPIMGNFLAENLTFPPMDLLNSATLHALYLYCLYCICIHCIVGGDVFLSSSSLKSSSLRYRARERGDIRLQRGDFKLQNREDIH